MARSALMAMEVGPDYKQIRNKVKIKKTRDVCQEEKGFETNFKPQTFLSLRSLLEASKFTCLKQVQTKSLWGRNVVKGSVYNAQ